MLDEVEPSLLVAMHAFAVGVTFDDDRLGVVAQNVHGNAAEVVQSAFQACHERYAALVVSELDVRVARESQFGRKRSQRQRSSPEDHEVDLQLPTGLGLKSHDRLFRRRRPNLAQILLELRDAALVSLERESRATAPSPAAGPCRPPRGALASSSCVRRVWSGAAGAGRTGRRSCPLGSHGPCCARRRSLGRSPGCPCPADAGPDLHLKLLLHHANMSSPRVQVGQFSTGGVGQFYSGANRQAQGDKSPWHNRATSYLCKRKTLVDSGVSW